MQPVLSVVERKEFKVFLGVVLLNTNHWPMIKTILYVMECVCLMSDRSVQREKKSRTARERHARQGGVDVIPGLPPAHKEHIVCVLTGGDTTRYPTDILF